MAASTEPRLHRWDELPEDEVTATIRRRMITGERMMLARLSLEQGAVVPMHSHENEQLTHIVEGALRFSFGVEGMDDVVVRAGEVLHIPSDVPHRAEALEDTIDVDVFSPPRQGWLDGTDSYFQAVDEPGGAANSG